MFKAGTLPCSLHMFPKSAQGNLSSEELEVFREVAKYLSGLGASEIEELVAKKEWIEIDEGKNHQELSK